MQGSENMHLLHDGDERLRQCDCRWVSQSASQASSPASYHRFAYLAQSLSRNVHYPPNGIQTLVMLYRCPTIVSPVEGESGGESDDVELGK